MSEGSLFLEKYNSTWLAVIVDFYEIFIKKYNISYGKVFVAPISDSIFVLRLSSAVTDSELTFIVTEKNKFLHYILKENDQLVSKGSIKNNDLEPLLIELHKAEIPFAETKNPA